MKRRTIAAAAAAALALLGTGSPASAQIFAYSTPLVIHAAPVPETELVAKKGEPLLVQTMTSLRNIRLTAQAPVLGWLPRKNGLPAGTELFGVQAPDGWIFCANEKSPIPVACYQDMDLDGRLDRLRRPMAPFANVPLLMYDFWTFSTLDQPVPYEQLPTGQGPSIGYAIRWNVPPKVAKPIQAIQYSPALKVGDRYERLGQWGMQPNVPLAGVLSRDVPIRILGAEIQPIALNPDGSLRYRVTRTMPTQILRIEMSYISSGYVY